MNIHVAVFHYNSSQVFLLNNTDDQGAPYGLSWAGPTNWVWKTVWWSRARHRLLIFLTLITWQRSMVDKKSKRTSITLRCRTTVLVPQSHPQQRNPIIVVRCRIDGVLLLPLLCFTPQEIYCSDNTPVPYTVVVDLKTRSNTQSRNNYVLQKRQKCVVGVRMHSMHMCVTYSSLTISDSLRMDKRNNQKMLTLRWSAVVSPMNNFVNNFLMVNPLLIQSLR